jgi:hypothetical protein
MNSLIELKDEYNLELRRHRQKKILAKIGILTATAVSSYIIGASLADLGVRSFSIAAAAFGCGAWGVWGWFFLFKRH